MLVAMLVLVVVISSPRPSETGTAVPEGLSDPATTFADGAGAGGSLAPHRDARGLAGDPAAGPEARASGPAASGHVAPAAIRVTSDTSFYDVEGGDVRTLLDSLRQRGPRDDRGSWAASTGWVFHWAYQPVVETGCRVQSARVLLDLSYTYPRWTPPSDAVPPLVAAWEGYLARVELHEHGHRDIAQRTAGELVRALEALPSKARCDDLAAAARSTVDEVMARHDREQRAYDDDTGHGATQGAMLSLDR